MKLSSNSRAARVIVVLIGTAVALSLLAPVAANAQSDEAEFRAAVSAARDSSEAAIHATEREMFEGVTLLSQEQWLMTRFAPNVPTMLAELNAYIAVLEGLDVPAEYAADTALQIKTLRELTTIWEPAVEAAAVGDIAEFDRLMEPGEGLFEDLAADVRPDYFEFAFISPFEGEDFRQFVGIADDEQVYLDGVVEAMDEFNRRNQQFGRALSGTYPSSAAQMNALYEAGAGDAFAAVRDLARELDPPERFADEHRLWLANLDRQVAVDRLIGENARDGDAGGFLANNIRLGFAAEPYPEIDPAFGSALGPGSRILGERLDPSDAEALGSYGEALFGFLRNYSDAPQNAVNALLFPGVPIEETMAAVVETSDLLSSEFAGSISELKALTPPQDLRPSHERLVAYFDEQGANLDALIEASAAGDGGAIFGVTESMRVAYCSAASDLTGAIEPVTSIHLDPQRPDCR